MELEKFQKHVLSAYHAPGTVLGAGDIAENETQSLCLGASRQGGVGREADYKSENKINHKL